MAEPVLLTHDVDEQIRVLTLHRAAKRNALSIQLLEAMAQAIVAAGQDPARRVLVIAADGPSFCAGLDLQEAAEASTARQSSEALAKVYTELTASSLVSIAAAHSAALGGGAGLIAACDLAVAAHDLRIGFPEVRRGLVAALVTALYRRQLGDHTLRRLVLLGEDVDAQRALQLGLVDQVVETGRLLEAAINVARQCCQAAPGAILRTKRLLNDLTPRPIEQDLHRALKDHLEARNSDEAREGIAAFFEKRPPRWDRRG